MRSAIVFAVLSSGIVASIGSSSADDGSSGPVPVSFSIENEYAESIFSASYDVPEAANLGDDFEGDASGVLADELRLDSYETHDVSDVFSAPEGTEVVVTFSSRSLGDDYEFDPITMEIGGPGESTCRIVYSYDLAEAAFSIGHGCD